MVERQQKPSYSLLHFVSQIICPRYRSTSGWLHCFTLCTCVVADGVPVRSACRAAALQADGTLRQRQQPRVSTRSAALCSVEGGVVTSAYFWDGGVCEREFHILRGRRTDKRRLTSVGTSWLRNGTTLSLELVCLSSFIQGCLLKIDSSRLFGNVFVQKVHSTSTSVQFLLRRN